MSEPRLRRTVLITPGDQGRLHPKMPLSGADVALLELEDAVRPDRKEIGRRTVAESLRDVDWRHCERVVRINDVDSADGQLDIQAVVPARPDALVLPKVRGAREVRLAADLVADAERAAGLPSGSVALWAMVETVQTVADLESVCAAHPRLSAAVLGAADLGVELGVKRLGLGGNRTLPLPAIEYVYARGRLVVAARAAGIDPIDIASTTFEDDDATRLAAEHSAQAGFAGCLVGTRRQIAIVNEAFSPSEDDVRWATEVIRETERADGSLAIVDGEIVDGPFVVSARRIVARHELIASRG